MKFDKQLLIIVILVGIIGFLSYKIYSLYRQSEYQLEQFHKKDDESGKYVAIYKDQTIASLKQTNAELYDSIKAYKDQIDYLIKFKHKKEYIIDTVYCDTSSVDLSKVSVFKYSNEQNDTLNYNLQIGSTVEPIWYSLDLSVSNEYTIISKKNGDVNQTEIIPSNKGDIDDVTVFKNKRTKFFDNFVVGPSVNVGYDVVNRNFGVMVGVSITYKIH